MEPLIEQTLATLGIVPSERRFVSPQRDGGAEMPVGSLRAPVSVLVVACNEAAHLAECLAALAFADEIIVVLDHTRDGSQDVARRFGARVIHGAWPLEGARRNAGIDACRNRWVLEVDADECVTPELAREIAQILPNASPGCFLIGYDNYVGQRLVRHGWGAHNGVSTKWNLFHKGCKVWGNQPAHPKVTIKGARQRLSGRVRHNVDDSLSAMFARLNRWSDQAAREAAASEIVGSAGGVFRRFCSRFYKSYIARKGYREGIYGIALALFAGLYPVFTYLKAREIQNTGVSFGKDHRACRRREAGKAIAPLSGPKG
ncbi:MAG: glycosyltransferase family 2 protein [Alphaproteobacteria bacterium]